MNANEPAQARAVFLDRDGVLIEDVDLLTSIEQARILPGVVEALRRLKAARFRLLVISNQTVVARGLATEQEVDEVNRGINERLDGLIDRFYTCPHHPQATLPAYRMDCLCRKPRPGLLLRAAEEFAVDLAASFFVGDRITDIIAGTKAGCRTILVETGRHLSAPIKTLEPIDPAIKPDYTCADLAAAAGWILR